MTIELSADGFESLDEDFLIRFTRSAEWESHRGGFDNTGALHREFYRHRIGLEKESLENSVELTMRLGGLAEIVLLRHADHLHDVLHKEIGSDTDHAFGPSGHEG